MREGYMKLEFAIKPNSLLGTSTSAIIEPGEDTIDALNNEILDCMAVNIDVTIGETTMFLAAWQDPDHWSDDWRRDQNWDCDLDEVRERVEEIINDALTT